MLTYCAQCEWDEDNQICTFCRQHSVPGCVRVRAPGQGEQVSTTPSGTTQFQRVSEVAKVYENQYPTAGYHEILSYVNAYQPQPPLQQYGMPMQTQQGGSGLPMSSVHQTAPYGSFTPYYGSGT